MLKRILVPALACATLFSTAAARAQDPAAGAPAKPPWLVACDADIKKNCDTEVKANSDVRPCLANHEADLSQACKDIFLRKYRVLEMCKDDIEKVCAGATGKALGECFNDAEKQKQMSEKCKSALRQGTKEHKQETAAAAGTKPATDKPAATADAKPAKPAAKGKHKKAAQ
jgi:hypothetical protein